ncbi:uncharacterized protein LOC8051231 isoform X4 [Ixodes scapularis]|uniref:uncharacterized protein LOC8051231 isoform X4 n=1 Tax=Ixodes scapularis TaxID=6945 RepID=UPI001AD774B2|nr:uncharacterized protein LOC8051231 isoform X4 [Ixodes scapularis]
MGRPRRLRSEQEEEERKERRRAQQREWLRNKRRRAAIASSSTASSSSESLAREERIARLERRREQNRECKRRRRANATDEDRAREAERKRQARRRQVATPAQQFPGATARFWREFMEDPFGVTCDRGDFGPDQLQMAPRRTSGEEENNGVQDEVEESILPDDGPGWGGSSGESTISANTIKTEPPDYVEEDKEPGRHLASVKSGVDGSVGNGTMAAVTIKTEPPEYVDQDEEPSCHPVSVKSEPEYYEEVREPGNPVPALTEGEPPDRMDVTKVTFHTNAEPQVSQEAQQRGNAAVAVKIEPQDPTGVDDSVLPMETGVDGSSGNGAMAAVTIKTEPPEYVEQDEEPSCHLLSVKSEPEYSEEVREPGNPVPALTEGIFSMTFLSAMGTFSQNATSCVVLFSPPGEPPGRMDVTKVTFHTNPEPQVSQEAQQRGNAAVAVKIEPQDPTEGDDQGLPAETGLGGAAPKQSQPDAVPVHPTGPHPVLARPPQGVVPPVSDRAQPRVKVVYFRKVERGIATQPVVTTLPVAALQSLLAAESPQPGVVPVWLPGSGPGAASLREVEQRRVHVDPILPMQPPRHAASAVCEPREDLVHKVEQS